MPVTILPVVYVCMTALSSLTTSCLSGSCVVVREFVTPGQVNASESYGPFV